MSIELRNKCQSTPGTVAIDAAKADWATALRVAASRGSGFSREICIHSRLKSLLQAIPFGTRRGAPLIGPATRLTTGI